MADEKITDLTLSSTLSASTLFEYVDILDTTDPITGDATGSNKAISGANLATALLAGYVGASTVTTLGTVATGVWSGTAVGVTKGGTGLVALPTANQVLGANSGATAYEGKTITSGTNVIVSHGTGAITLEEATIPTHTLWGNTTGGTALASGVTLTAMLDAAIASVQGDVLYRGASAWSALAPGSSWQSLQSGGASANPAWGNPLPGSCSLTGVGGQKTGTTPVTLFSGGSYAVTGSLTIPANRLVAGSLIRLFMCGDLTGNNPDQMTITIKLGSVTVLTGLTGSLTATSGMQWFLRDCWLSVQTGGASGAIRGNGNLVSASGAATTGVNSWLTTGGSGTASTAATIDCTATQALDVLVSFNSASGTNQIRLNAFHMSIQG